MALFSDRKSDLWRCKRAVIDRLSRLRLRIHQSSAQASPVDIGIPWLGFVVYPTHRLIKARMARKARKNLERLYSGYTCGQVSFAELDAAVKGWLNHVRYADSWGLRRAVFASM